MRTTSRIFSLSALTTFFLSIAAVGAYAQTALQFVPVTPCRVVDTRKANGQFGGPAIQGGTSRDFAIPQGACNIPATAAAYSLNVTVVPHGALWLLTVWPTGQPLPNSSLMNSWDGRIKANAAIVPAGTPNESVSVYASNTTDVLLDIDGYFIPATDATLAYYPLPACRIADTRGPLGVLGGPYLQGGAPPRTFPVLDAVNCNIPSSAKSYSLNFTVIPRVKPLWVLSAWPTGQPLPSTSILNDPTGTVVANAALIPAGISGSITVSSSADTDLLIDIDGYFAPPGQTGLALYALNTCRVLDTRNGQGLFEGQLAVNVVGSNCQVPANAQSYVLNATVVPQGPLWLLTLWPDGQPIPSEFSTLNAWDGAVTSNMAIVSTDNGSIDAYAAGETNLILDTAGYFAPLPLLSVTTTSLPAGTAGQPYPQTQLNASGGEPPYSWAVTTGSLPTGLTLTDAGVISGTPTTAGVYSFTVQATDALGNTASAALSITIQAGSLVVITTTLPNGTATVAYNATLAAGGGTPPYTWSVISGTLPAGLTLTANSGLISGTPTTAGVSNFTVQVQDAALNTAQAPLQIVINAATNNAALNGFYAFSFNGFSQGNPVFMAGSFFANGNGNIVSGVLDFNSGSGSSAIGYPFTGTYTVTANGLGVMSLHAGSLGVLDFHLAVSQLGNGTFIQDNEDPNQRGSGVLYVQNPAGFSIPPAGGYSVGTVGADQNFSRYAKGGAFQLDTHSNVSGGMEDVNDNGALSSRLFTGHFQPPVAPTGRGQATLDFPNGVTNNYAYYVVFTGEYILLGTDPLSSQDPLTLATMAQQPSHGFSNASLTGVSVLEVSGVAPNGGQPEANVALGLLTADGNGTATVSLDQNKGGTLTQQQLSQGTYSVASNGRVTLSGFGGTPPILYLSNPNQAFVIGQDNSATAGILEPQTATPPYNNLSIFGTYLGGTTTPVLSALVDSVSWLFADGNGNINGIEDTSGPSGTGTQNLAATYLVDATGRAVVTGTPAGIMYVVSAKKVVLLPSGNNPVLSTYSAASTN